jgi:hypothetical protein
MCLQICACTFSCMHIVFLKYFTVLRKWSRLVVGTVTGLWAGELRNHGLISSRGKRFCHFSKISNVAVGPQSGHLQWGGSLPKCKMARSGGWPFILSSMIVMNERKDASTCICAWMVCKGTAFYLVTILSIFVSVQPLQVSKHLTDIHKIWYGYYVTRGQWNVIRTAWLMLEFVRLEQCLFHLSKGTWSDVW